MLAPWRDGTWESVVCALQCPGQLMAETMNSRRSFVAASCLFLTFAAACSSGASTLQGTTWMFVQPDSGLQIVSLAPEDVTITFGPDGVVTGTYTYITYEGHYTDDGASVTISDLRWTSAICGMESCLVSPDAYLETLGRAGRYEVEDGRLQIDAGDRQLSFVESRSQ